jgi:hypothetical protein
MTAVLSRNLAIDVRVSDSSPAALGMRRIKPIGSALRTISNPSSAIGSASQRSGNSSSQNNNAATASAFVSGVTHTHHTLALVKRAAALGFGAHPESTVAPLIDVCPRPVHPIETENARSSRRQLFILCLSVSWRFLRNSKQAGSDSRTTQRPDLGCKKSR